MWKDVEQNSKEWFGLRLGKVTSSNFAKIMANEDKAFGKPALEYAQRTAVESVTHSRLETYSNSFMDRGHEYEPIAIAAYEAETFNKVTNGGFFSINGQIGDSPDGLVGEDGCIEVKTVIYNQHFKRLEKGGIDTAYKWQIQGHLWVGEREWCDFISYCPEMPESKKLYVHRVERDEDMIERLPARVLSGASQYKKDGTLKGTADKLRKSGALRSLGLGRFS